MLGWCKNNKGSATSAEKYGYKKKKVQTKDCIRGIVVTDQELSSEYESYPKTYGGTGEKLKPEELAVLSLPPKFTIPDEVEYEECAAQIEKAWTKLRWNRRNNGEPEEDGESEEENNEAIADQRTWAVETEKNNADFRYLRPTDLPFNKRNYLGQKLEYQEEMKLQTLGNNLLEITDNYIAEQKQKTTQGERKYSNLTREENKGLESLIVLT